MITILAVTDGFKHFDTAIDEYQKRLQKSIIFKKIRPIAHTNPEYIKIKETLSIIEVLKKMRGKIWLLDERGKSISTYDVVDMIEHGKNESEDIIYVIGGSYGVDLEVFSQIPHKTGKISDCILPHSLALLILLEQIYRANEIIK